VHKDFSDLFAMKVQIFLTELLSVLLTPLVLLFSLPPCAGAIIDFFREFTVHVEGVGYVCSFAVFDFRRHGATQPSNLPDTPDADVTITHRKKDGQVDWRRSNENKMEKSFLHFKATHPDWQPSDPAGSMFLDRLTNLRDKGKYSGPVNRANQERGGGAMGTSIYAGGRGLGLGGQGVEYSRKEGELRARSRSYDKAWVKSVARVGQGKLEPMAETEYAEGREEGLPSEEGDEEWNRRLDDHGFGREEGDERFLKDVGMMGLLQQVIGR
jgi:autophagy-related protein 9